MNKEQQELLDEAYKAFEKWYNEHSGKEDYTGYFVPDKEEFIRLIKTDDLFSEKWGLKIEERELSLEEKEWQLEKTNCINDIENDRVIYGHKWEKYIQEQYEGIQSNQGIKIPTKLITLEYNGIKIESYE